MRKVVHRQTDKWTNKRRQKQYLFGRDNNNNNNNNKIVTVTINTYHYHSFIKSLAYQILFFFFFFLKELIEEDQKTLNRDALRDLIDTYLIDMEVNKDPESIQSSKTSVFHFVLYSENQKSYKIKVDSEITFELNVVSGKNSCYFPLLEKKWCYFKNEKSQY